MDVCFAEIMAEREKKAGTSVSRKMCIAAEALAHLPSTHLVYPEHAQALVLCDLHGSCATPGHIVEYLGTGMMMKTYCYTVGGCEENIMPVNSPRMSKVRRVKSKTTGLIYTAFAARHETSLEEHAMAVLVRADM